MWILGRAKDCQTLRLLQVVTAFRKSSSGALNFSISRPFKCAPGLLRFAFTDLLFARLHACSQEHMPLLVLYLIPLLLFAMAMWVMLQLSLLGNILIFVRAMETRDRDLLSLSKFHLFTCSDTSSFFSNLAGAPISPSAGPEEGL